jgi:hypothetical protein
MMTNFLNFLKLQFNDFRAPDSSISTSDSSDSCDKNLDSKIDELFMKGTSKNHNVWSENATLQCT